MGGEFGQRAEWSQSRSLDWELLDTDATDTPWHGLPASATLLLPANAVLWLAPY